MKANYKIISTILLIVLVALLIGIMVNYYNTPIKVNNTTSTFNNSGNITDTSRHNNPITIDENDSGDFESNKDNKQETRESFFSENKDKSSQVIITSEDTMTNKEKREILNELDNTLMELLDVVNKVQTVDESRLITEESEVQ